SVFFFQAEDGIRDLIVTGVQTCALPICPGNQPRDRASTPELGRRSPAQGPDEGRERSDGEEWNANQAGRPLRPKDHSAPASRMRSEERRVGKEWRSGGAPAHQRRKKERT